MTTTDITPDTTPSTTPLNFAFYGERPALDFANTLRRRKDPHTPTGDLLQQEGIHTWFNAAHKKAAWAAELPYSAPDAHTNKKNLEKGIALRSLIITLAENTIRTSSQDIHNNRDDENLPTPADLNTFAAGSAIAYEADAHGLLLPTVTPEMVLSFVAHDALRLFTSDARGRIKMCSHERCGMLFEDHSNGKRRKWCSMKECGNRSKVARHAHSH